MAEWCAPKGLRNRGREAPGSIPADATGRHKPAQPIESWPRSRAEPRAATRGLRTLDEGGAGLTARLAPEDQRQE